MEDACKDDNELEEGECSDQDDVGMSNSEAMKQDEHYRNIDTGGGYRQGRIPQIIINSDQSDQGDSDYDDNNDDFHSQGKKACRFSNVTNDQFSTSTSFVNPLRSSGVTESFIEGASRKRRNNIWGAVMTEQILSHDIKQFGVNAPLTSDYRDVESYDFTIAKEDDRPNIEIKTDTAEKEDIFGEVVDLEKEVRRQQNRKRKRNVKEYLGVKVAHERKRLSVLNVTENDDPVQVSQAVINGLGEKNVTLFSRIVMAIGNEKAIQLYNKTVDVESVGGMMINNGFRRRTPGGVYIQLLKNEPSIPESVVSGLFEQDEQKWIEKKKELRKIKKAARKKWKKKEKRLNMDFDRPETPTPTKELEELDNGNEVEEADVDVSDLPDRPDTPEPKDSSDNVSEEEEEDDEEDIAVAIAKAKAAILKKQKEMVESENKIEDERSSGNVIDEESVDMS